MSPSAEKDGLLDPKYMDGPVIQWTVADTFQKHPRLFMAYHVMGAGWDFLTPMGSALGAVMYGAGIFRPYPSLLATMGTCGLATGAAGMALGLTRMTLTAQKGEHAQPIPWTDEGVQQRVDGLRHNFKVRIMDLSAWTGIGLGAVALAAVGGPTKLGLSAGSLGVLQALALGSTLGSLSGLGCIYATKSKDDDSTAVSDHSRG